MWDISEFMSEYLVGIYYNHIPNKSGDNQKEYARLAGGVARDMKSLKVVQSTFKAAHEMYATVCRSRGIPDCPDNAYFFMEKYIHGRIIKDHIKGFSQDKMWSMATYILQNVTDRLTLFMVQNYDKILVRSTEMWSFFCSECVDIQVSVFAELQSKLMGNNGNKHIEIATNVSNQYKKLMVEKDRLLAENKELRERITELEKRHQPAPPKKAKPTLKIVDSSIDEPVVEPAQPQVETEDYEVVVVDDNDEFAIESDL